MGRDGRAPGVGGLQLAGGARLLRPEEQVFAAMLEGGGPSSWPATWRSRPSAKRLAAIAGVHRSRGCVPWVVERADGG